MFNIRCAFRHLELLTRCALVQAKYLKYGFVMVLHVIGPNYTRESDAQNAGNGVSEVQISKIFRGGMPGPPNYVTYSRMIRSDFSLDPPLENTNEQISNIDTNGENNDLGLPTFWRSWHTTIRKCFNKFACYRANKFCHRKTKILLVFLINNLALD